MANFVFNGLRLNNFNSNFNINFNTNFNANFNSKLNTNFNRLPREIQIILRSLDKIRKKKYQSKYI